MAGSNVDSVVRALLIAKHKGMPVKFWEACAFDLIERDPASIANLCGQTAVALEALDPDGRIQVGGEEYKATLPNPEDAESLGVSLPEGDEGADYFVEGGESVRIVQYLLGFDGFCVEPWQGPDARSQARGTAQGGGEVAEAGG